MIIRLNSLKEGYQEITMPVNISEIDIIEEEFIYPVSITLKIEKFKSQINIHGTLHTELDLVCDRCLEHFKYKIDPEFIVIFKISPNKKYDMADEIKIISPFENNLDITQDIKDSLLLSIPMKKLCHPDCKGICPGCFVNLNYEECKCIESPIDPRWDVLSKLFSKQ
ncbi:MAG: DUF177 domain-containing protein [Candidatus Marinimicrobia bacterium]|nr:DUF177 domain-containing protein [Candidatus Neomarinimicrobiota bacterium]